MSEGFHAAHGSHPRAVLRIPVAVKADARNFGPLRGGDDDATRHNTSSCVIPVHIACRFAAVWPCFGRDAGCQHSFRQSPILARWHNSELLRTEGTAGPRASPASRCGMAKSSMAPRSGPIASPPCAISRRQHPGATPPPRSCSGALLNVGRRGAWPWRRKS